MNDALIQFDLHITIEGNPGYSIKILQEKPAAEAQQVNHSSCLQSELSNGFAFQFQFNSVEASLFECELSVINGKKLLLVFILCLRTSIYQFNSSQRMLVRSPTHLADPMTLTSGYVYNHTNIPTGQCHWVRLLGVCKL